MISMYIISISNYESHHFDPSTHDLWDATGAGEANPSAVTLPGAWKHCDVQGLYEFTMILPGSII